MRWPVVILTFLLTAAAVLYFWPGTAPRPASPHSKQPKPGRPEAPAVESGKKPGPEIAPGGRRSGGAGSAATFNDADYPIVAPLNAPGGTVAQDMAILNQLFEAWRSNFPRDGNPVGENAEITAALMGDNRLELVLVPRGHRAVNDRGELCDRWGTPLRFHQLSGTKMEIRSAGPDRKFATDDDAVWALQ